MSATTSWWFCGVCGFRNHPRQNQDPKRCEQCGATSAEEAAVDYVPKEG